MIMSLFAISSDATIDSNTSVMVDSQLSSLCKSDTISTAHIFMPLFRETSNLSNYLQTSGLDFLTVNRLISQVFSNIKKLSRDFEAVKTAAKNCVISIKNSLNTYRDEGNSITI